MKVIGSNIHAIVYDKRNYIEFSIHVVNFPWLNDDVPRLQSYGIFNS